MQTPVYVGDEVSASGYRLAGLRVIVPGKEGAEATLASACRDASLVLVSAAFARQLPRDTLEPLLAAAEPRMVVVPDIRGQAPLEDLSTRMRRQLGMLE